MLGSQSGWVKVSLYSKNTSCINCHPWVPPVSLGRPHPGTPMCCSAVKKTCKPAQWAESRQRGEHTLTAGVRGDKAGHGALCSLAYLQTESGSCSPARHRRLHRWDANAGHFISYPCRTSRGRLVSLSGASSRCFRGRRSCPIKM